MNPRAFLLLIVVSGAIEADVLAPANPDAQAFMRETLASYRAMSSYRDHGYLVETLQSSPDGKNPGAVTQEFVTLFKRPDKFKFAWTTTDNFGDGSDKDQDAIWSDGTKVWGSWSSQDHNVPETLQDLDTAVASATGISHRMAHQIFALLSDDVTGFRLDMLRHVKIVRSETMHGVDCYVVHGAQYEDQHELWIGKLDHLIRKGIDTHPDGTTATFERRDIAVDQDVAASEFTWRKELGACGSVVAHSIG